MVRSKRSGRNGFRGDRFRLHDVLDEVKGQNLAVVWSVLSGAIATIELDRRL